MGLLKGFEKGLVVEKILVIGAGKFGVRAVERLSKDKGPELWVVDKDVDALEAIKPLCPKVIEADGVEFLARHPELFAQRVTIVPAIPVHLAFRWFYETYSGPGKAQIIEIPDHLLPSLPFVLKGNDGTVYLSHADFLCPDDCPEPIRCTVTGEARKPLYEIIPGARTDELGLVLIRSRQMAPGVGGYPINELSRLRQTIEEKGSGKWIIATSCRCHASLSALEIIP